LLFRIDPASRVAVFQQIVEQLEQAVAMGRVPAHHQLPTVRELALQLLINPNTVQKAFSELTRKGLIYSKKGVGMFVTEWAPSVAPKLEWSQLEPELDRFLTRAILAGYEKGEISQRIQSRLEHYQGESA